MSVDWWAVIDNYCERTDASFWAEPLNALSNASFLVAALVSWMVGRRASDRLAQVLAVGAAGIGVGSFLFHTFANVLTLQADVIPIRVFVVAYTGLAVVRFFAAPRWVGAAAAAAVVPFSYLVVEVLGASVGRLGGSIGYLPVPLLAVMCALALMRRSPGMAGSLLAAAAVFVVSLGFRTIDLLVCTQVPIGTHFVWHLLNGVVVGGLIVLFIRARSDG